MREPQDNDLENALKSDEQAVILTLEDAKTIARALIVMNNQLVAEFNKIQNTPDVSDLIIAAAHQQYNELTKAGTELHIQLAQLFPELTQP